MNRFTNQVHFTKYHQIGALVLLSQIGIAPLIYKTICTVVVRIIS